MSEKTLEAKYVKSHNLVVWIFSEMPFTNISNVHYSLVLNLFSLQVLTIGQIMQLWINRTVLLRNQFASPVNVLQNWIQMAHYALTQQQGASLDTSWSNFTTEWAQEHSRAWDVLCGNTSVIILPFKLYSDLFKASSLFQCANTKSRESSSSENCVRLLNSALFTPDSSMRKISSSKPGAVEKLHRHSPEQDSERLKSNEHCRVSVHTEDDKVAQLTTLSHIRNTAF